MMWVEVCCGAACCDAAVHDGEDHARWAAASSHCPHVAVEVTAAADVQAAVNGWLDAAAAATAAVAGWLAASAHRGAGDPREHRVTADAALADAGKAADAVRSALRSRR